MLDLKEVSKNYDSVVERLKARGGNLDLGPFQSLFSERSALNRDVQALSQQRNQASEEIKKNPKAISEDRRTQLRALGEQIKEKDGRLKEVEDELSKILFL